MADKLANALVLSPRLLLLDEPSLGLSPALVSEAFGRIQQLNRDNGVELRHRQVCGACRRTPLEIEDWKLRPRVRRGRVSSDSASGGGEEMGRGRRLKTCGYGGDGRPAVGKTGAEPRMRFAATRRRERRVDGGKAKRDEGGRGEG